MKTGFAVSTLLSGIVFALLMTTMGGCQRSMIVARDGSLVDVDSVNAPAGATKAVYSWDTHLRPFQHLKSRVIPGDRLDSTESWWTLPYLSRVERQTLVVTRDGREYLRARNGHVVFWTSLIGVSLIPLAVWSVLAIWVATVPAPPQKLGSP